MPPQSSHQSPDGGTNLPTAIPDYEEDVRLLDSIIASWQSLDDGADDFYREVEAELHTSLLDEMIAINCTPMGVSTELHSPKWRGLAQDWKRVGSYMREVMA